MKEYFDNELLSDITVSILGKDYKLHKLVLYANSGYFKSLIPYMKDNYMVIDDVGEFPLNWALDLIKSWYGYYIYFPLQEFEDYKKYVRMCHYFLIKDKIRGYCYFKKWDTIYFRKNGLFEISNYPGKWKGREVTNYINEKLGDQFIDRIYMENGYCIIRFIDEDYMQIPFRGKSKNIIVYEILNDKIIDLLK